MEKNCGLQYCNFGPDEIQSIVEVNPDKFGCMTPGTCIPIISESDANANLPDYYLVLPWHFENFILADFIKNGIIKAKIKPIKK